jgi:hypothetical protein
MTTLTVKDLLPEDGTRGTLVGRVWLPQANGPAVVAVRGDGVFDVTAKFPTVSALCEEDNPAKALAASKGERIGDLSVLWQLEQGLERQPIPAAINRGAYYMSNWDALADLVRETGKLPTTAAEAAPVVSKALEVLGRFEITRPVRLLGVRVDLA